MSKLEVYGTKHCSYTAELIEELNWQGQEFVYHDVEEEEDALRRMLELTGNQRTVPVLVLDCKVKQIGYQGRGCVVDVS